MKRSVGRSSDSIDGRAGLFSDKQTCLVDQQTFSETSRLSRPATGLLTRRTDLFKPQVTRATVQQSGEPRKDRLVRQLSHLREEQTCSAGERVYCPMRWPFVQGVELSSPLQLSSLVRLLARIPLTSTNCICMLDGCQDHETPRRLWSPIGSWPRTGDVSTERLWTAPRSTRTAPAASVRYRAFTSVSSPGPAAPARTA